MKQKHSLPDLRPKKKEDEHAPQVETHARRRIHAAIERYLAQGKLEKSLPGSPDPDIAAANGRFLGLTRELAARPEYHHDHDMAASVLYHAQHSLRHAAAAATVAPGMVEKFHRIVGIESPKARHLAAASGLMDVAHRFIVKGDHKYSEMTGAPLPAFARQPVPKMNPMAFLAGFHGERGPGKHDSRGTYWHPALQAPPGQPGTAARFVADMRGIAAAQQAAGQPQRLTQAPLPTPAPVLPTPHAVIAKPVPVAPKQRVLPPPKVSFP